jgi:hypothetical protein
MITMSGMAIFYWASFFNYIWMAFDKRTCLGPSALVTEVSHRRDTQALPTLHSSYVPEGLAQVVFWASRNWVVLHVRSAVYVYVLRSPVEIQSPARWNMIGRSMTVSPLVLSPSSILPSPSSHIYVVAREHTPFFIQGIFTAKERLQHLMYLHQKTYRYCSTIHFTSCLDYSSTVGSLCVTATPFDT